MDRGGPRPWERRRILCSPGCGGGGGVVAASRAGSPSDSREGDDSDIISSNQVSGRRLSVWLQFFDSECAGGAAEGYQISG